MSVCGVILLTQATFQVDFKLQSEEGDTATFIENGEWALLGTQLSPPASIISIFTLRGGPHLHLFNSIE